MKDIKQLEVEFVQNSDKRGNNTFKQIKRNDKAALYRRFDMEGKPQEFEVFKIKVAGGLEVFGRFYDKYEQYPGSASFGKSAWSTTSEVIANRMFDRLTNGLDVHGNTEPLKKQDRVVGTKGRKKTLRAEVVLPTDKKLFNMKDLLSINKEWNQPVLYVQLQKFIQDKKVELAEKRQTGRGKPTNFYRVTPV
jgi:hypothetical protein